jgi:hypothetical protein
MVLGPVLGAVYDDREPFFTLGAAQSPLVGSQISLRRRPEYRDLSSEAVDYIQQFAGIRHQFELKLLRHSRPFVPDHCRRILCGYPDTLTFDRFG